MTDRSRTTVLVTGAGGHIGQAVCRDLLRRGHRVRALLAPGESDAALPADDALERMEGDVRDAARMREAARGCEAVVHGAALNVPFHRPASDFEAINVSGTEHVIDAAMAAEVKRFVHISSCEVMGPALPGGPRDETHREREEQLCGPYGLSKRAAEQLVRRRVLVGLPAVVLRPTAVFGPGELHGTPPGRLVRAALAGAIPAFYDAGINAVDARDVATACANALERGAVGELYIVGGENVRLSQILHQVAEAGDIPAPSRTVGYATAYLVTLMRYGRALLTGKNPGVTPCGLRTVRHPWYFETAKAENELRIEPRPLEETIRDMVRWYREEAPDVR